MAYMPRSLFVVVVFMKVIAFMSHRNEEKLQLFRRCSMVVPYILHRGENVGLINPFL
jgi:hypothetical protein